MMTNMDIRFSLRVFEIIHESKRIAPTFFANLASVKEGNEIAVYVNMYFHMGFWQPLSQLQRPCGLNEMMVSSSSFSSSSSSSSSLLFSPFLLVAQTLDKL